MKETVEEFLARGGSINRGTGRTMGVPRKQVTAKHHNRAHGGRVRNASAENVERQIVNSHYRGKI